MTHDPIVKTIHVSLDPGTAFELFTARMSDWWPLGSHSVSAGEGKVSQSLAIDPKVGGAVTEVGHDGTRHVWGHIQDWAPGAHFAMSWHPGKSAERQTHVRVEFAPDAWPGRNSRQCRRSPWTADRYCGSSDRLACRS